jgi:hypothetical protein
MKTYWGVGGISTHSLTSALDGGNGQLHALAVLPPGEKAPGTYCIGGWVGPGAGLDTVSKRKIPSPRRDSNLAKHHAMKTYWDIGGISTPSLTSALDGGKWSASRPGRFTPQGKSPWYPLYRRLDGPQSRSGHCVEEKNSQPPRGFESTISNKVTLWITRLSMPMP